MHGPGTAVESNAVTENQIQTCGLQLVLSKYLNYQEFIPKFEIFGIPMTCSVSIGISRQDIVRDVQVC